jgi:tetratricopeptide (TPR) repeat protein
LERGYGDALKQPPADLLLAKLYRKANRGDRVEAICKRLLDSADLNTLAFAADFYAAEGRTAEATAVLQKVRASQADPAATQMILGSHALRSNERAKATEHFAAAVRIAPKNPTAWRQLARMQIMNADDEAALKTLAGSIAALPEDRGLAAAARHAPAVLKLKQRWPELAGMLSDMLDAPGEEQTLAAVLDLLGRADGSTPLTPGAVSRLWALAGSRPQFYPLQVLATRVCVEAGRKDDACVVARRAAELSDESFGLAVKTLADAGRWAEAVDLFRPKLTQTPQWRIDCMRFAATIVPDQWAAAALLREVEPLAKKGVVLERLALAESWQVLGKRTGGASFTARARELTTDLARELNNQPHSAEVMLSLACLQEAHGDAKAAESSYRKALEMNPSLTIAQNNLAMLLARQGGNLDEALQLATRAASSSDANVVSFHDTLAFVRVQRKEYDAALATLTAALKLKPDHLWCQIRMTDVLAMSGQVEKARESLEQLERELPKRGPLSAEMTGRLQDVRSRLMRGAS